MSRRRVETRGGFRPVLAAFLKARRRDESAPLSVGAFAAEAGCSKQTLHNHDKRVDARHQVVFRIHRARKRREALLNRRSAAPVSKRSRAGDAERIARLVQEVEKWKTWYHNLLDKHLILEETARSNGWPIEKLYDRGLTPPNRSVSKAGTSSRIVPIDRVRYR